MNHCSRASRNKKIKIEKVFYTFVGFIKFKTNNNKK